MYYDAIGMNDETCQICHERVTSDDGVRWRHRDGAIYCGTGDGSTAYPASRE